ncbi:hypothetical protein GCM10010331_37390 [Streptomyces xanthochromogenes]|nr:hypothetical protein GCM10010331_37390 [Streptomyces xanthochromogenes]
MHLRDAEILRDPALGHLPEEPHVEDLPFALGQAAQARLDGLAVDYDVEGRVGAPQGVAQAVSLAIPREFGVQGKRAEAVDGFEPRSDLVLGHAGVRREIRRTGPLGRAVRGELLRRRTHATPQVLYPARHMKGPHVVAEVPLDLTGDGGHGVTLEGGTAARVVPVDGLDESERRDLTEVLKGLAPVPEAAGEALGHGQPGADEVLAQGVPFGPVRQCREAFEGGRGPGRVVVRVPVVRRAGVGTHMRSSSLERCGGWLSPGSLRPGVVARPERTAAPTDVPPVRSTEFACPGLVGPNVA